MDRLTNKYQTFILDNTKIAKYDIKLKSYVMSVKEYLSKYKI